MVQTACSDCHKPGHSDAYGRKTGPCGGKWVAVCATCGGTRLSLPMHDRSDAFTVGMEHSKKLPAHANAVQLRLIPGNGG